MIKLFSLMSFSRNLVFSSHELSGGPVMMNGKRFPKMQCSMTIAALSIFGTKTKIALTGVGGRVRESLAKCLI